MHIGLVSRGDTAYTLDLANLLHEAGLSISLYLSYEHTVGEVGTRDRPAERLYELGLLPSQCRVHLVKPPRMRNLFSLATYSRLGKTIRDDGVEVVHILAGPHELWLAVLAYISHAIPVVGTMIVPRPNVGESIPPFLSRLINKLLAYGSDMVIVNGEDQVKFVQNLYGVSANRVAFVPLNARTIPVKRPVQRDVEEPGTILFFGAARPHKGLEYLVRAQPVVSRQVPHACFLISAHGEDLQRCRQMIVDDSKFDIHEGYVSGEGMVGLFQRASLVVLPYLSASTSGVLMIAYSFGKPVVATKVGCLPEYVEDNITGVLVDPADVEQLAEAIIHLLTNDALRNRMGENARQWVEAKNKEVARQTISVYEKAIAIHAASKTCVFSGGKGGDSKGTL
jgi:glycosyltransferase involved in cell wall biosynthesis